MNMEEFIEGWKHFCKCVNFGQSAMDADSIVWMNEFEKNIRTFAGTEINDEMEALLMKYRELFDCIDGECARNICHSDCQLCRDVVRVLKTLKSENEIGPVQTNLRDVLIAKTKVKYPTYESLLDGAVDLLLVIRAMEEMNKEIVRIAEE